jgi:hypothetical protein
MSKVQHFLYLLILCIAISVLGSPKGVSDSFYTVDNRAAKIINRIDLPFCACTMVKELMRSGYILRIYDTAIDDRVSQGSI